MWYGCQPDKPDSIWIPLAKLLWGFHMALVVSPATGPGYAIRKSSPTLRYPEQEEAFTDAFDFPIWNTVQHAKVG
jgi:hypothetical protein